jgi:hypothetical protein
MAYNVVNKNTGEVKSLAYTEVNDMDYDNEGRVMVYGMDQEVYYLIADVGMITD